LSARHDYSGASLGQELWSVSIILVGLSSILGSLNYITTIINNRAPGMTWFRMPLSVWSLFITAILGLLALPVLSGAAIMLLFDQIIGTHFFDPAAGGQALLWQHLFWFFGHPEVYILILPAMGMVSDLHGGDTGGHANPRHLLHRGPPALRAVRRQPVRAVRRHRVLVPEDVRPDDERGVGQGALLAHIHLL